MEKNINFNVFIQFMKHAVKFSPINFDHIIISFHAKV